MDKIVYTGMTEAMRCVFCGKRSQKIPRPAELASTQSKTSQVSRTLPALSATCTEGTLLELAKFLDVQDVNALGQIDQTWRKKIFLVQKRHFGIQGESSFFASFCMQKFLYHTEDTPITSYKLLASVAMEEKLLHARAIPFSVNHFRWDEEDYFRLCQLSNEINRSGHSHVNIDHLLWMHNSHYSQSHYTFLKQRLVKASSSELLRYKQTVNNQVTGYGLAQLANSLLRSLTLKFEDRDSQYSDCSSDYSPNVVLSRMICFAATLQSLNITDTLSSSS